VATLLVGSGIWEKAMIEDRVKQERLIDWEVSDLRDRYSKTLE